MATGCSVSTNGKYKIGGLFSVSSRAVISSSATTYGWYSDELGGWISANGTAEGEAPSGLGQNSTVNNGASVYSTSDCTGTAIATVTTGVTLVSFSARVLGSGSITISNSPTIYGGRYVASGTSISLTVNAASGSQIDKVYSNGTEISYPYSVAPSTDTIVEADFILSSYTLSPNSIVGGTMAVTKGGSPVSGSVVKGDSLHFVCTASSGYVFSYATVNGSRYAASTINYIVPGSPTDGIIEYGAVFTANRTVNGTLTVRTGGTAEVQTSGGTKISDENGNFSATVGSSYKIVSTPSTGKIIDGVYDGDVKVSSTSPYVFTQYDSAKDFIVAFKDGTSADVSLYCGGDSSSTESTWNDCSCTMSHNETSYTFVPSAASGYEFVNFYVFDLDETGKGLVTTSHTFTIDFKAKVVAVFKSSTAPTEPSDEDQGRSPTISSGSVYVWEGSTQDRMTAIWASRRNVFMKPIPLSCARIYADGYGSLGPKLNVKQYESPSATDISPSSVSIVASSQDAFRLPVRRPEKYVELEIETNYQVLEVTVGTSMGALCQKAT